MLTGSALGMLPSASIGPKGQPELFEQFTDRPSLHRRPGVANPLRDVLSAAMMLRYCLGDGARGEPDRRRGSTRSSQRDT